MTTYAMPDSTSSDCLKAMQKQCYHPELELVRGSSNGAYKYHLCMCCGAKLVVALQEGTK